MQSTVFLSAMSRRITSKTKNATTKTIAAKVEPRADEADEGAMALQKRRATGADQALGEGATPSKKRAPGACTADAGTAPQKKRRAVGQDQALGEGATASKKRPPGAGTGDAGTVPFKKGRATGKVMKRPAAKDCTQVVAVKEKPSTRKDRNKWGFLMRNRDSLDYRVSQMLSGANQREKAVLVNNVVRRNNEGDWEFDIKNPVLRDKIAKFMQRYTDDYDQGQPYEVALSMWGGLDKLNRALQEGKATKVEKDGRLFIKWKGFQVGTREGVQQTTEVRAGAAISGEEAIEFSNLCQSWSWDFKLKKSERQVMVEWYTIHV